MTMVEKVAEAIEKQTGNHAVNWTDTARAAIEAMRDLPPNLQHVLVSQVDRTCYEPSDVHDGYRAMIGAALKE